MKEMSAEIQKILQNTDAVCFDVDSTVIQEEGIDQLANFCDKSHEVASITRKAMAGVMSYQTALKTRLDIIQPTIQQVKDFIRTCPPTLTPGIKDLINLLQKRKVPIYLISGGFRSIIGPIANQLNIPSENIFANRLKFYYTGEYAGFDEEQPTSRSGGKKVVINNLKIKYGYKNLVMIGDGMTDLEAAPPADAFIGYGGNVFRPEVKAKSKWYVTNFTEIIYVLE